MALRLPRPAGRDTNPSDQRRVWRFWLPAWLGMLTLAFTNGAARVVGYQDSVGELAARQIATQILIVLLFGYVWLLHRSRPLPDRGTALAVGGAWTALTLTFEFGFGHYVLGTPWSGLLADYDLTQGRIWILVPIATFVAPAVVRALQKRTR